MNTDESKRSEIVKLYIDGAKTFVQLSSAGLVLPLVFMTDVAGLFGKERRFSQLGLFFVCLSWICFLVAIGAGALYQYVAVKFIEYEADSSRTYLSRLLRPLVLVYGPGVVYGVMIVAFYVGAVSIVAYTLAAILT